MDTDITPTSKSAETSTPQPPTQGGISSFMNKKLPSKLFPFMTAGGAIGITIAAFVIGFAIAWSMIKFREPITPTTAMAGGSYCSNWGGAYTGYQTAITDAANARGIPPALLGAIFLSEHYQTWPQREMAGTWDTEGNIQGPFQFSLETWEGNIRFFGKNPPAREAAYTMSDIDDFSKAVHVAAYEVWGLANSHSWDPKNLDDNQIRCVAAGYNKGGAVCNRWADSRFSGDPESVDVDDHGPYDKRALQSYKDLNEGCTSYTGTPAMTPKGLLKVPGLDQRDPIWKDSSIYNGGCDLTSAAMVARAFGGKDVTPKDVRAKGGSRAYMKNNDYYSTSDADHWTVASGGEFPAKRIAEYIKKKQPIVMRFRNFTGIYWKTGKEKLGQTHGHYVVIVDISEDGKTIFVQDPFPWLEVKQDPKNGNPPIPRSADASKYGVNTDGVSRFEFWATKGK